VCVFVVGLMFVFVKSFDSVCYLFAVEFWSDGGSWVIAVSASTARFVSQPAL
jgi:uncharacterized membrane protein